MEARKKRNIKPGNDFDHLFPKSEGANKTIRRNADVSDTVAFIPKVVHETLNQTEAISRKLKGSNVYETCSRVWHFVYQHINYKKDQEGYEQIRSPSRAWKDRISGVDCDCFSTFISSILTNLGIKHKLRITKYWKSYFQHIYPVVQNGRKEIILDCVTDKFDYEVPYSENKDYPMDLQYLNGFDDGGMDELGKIFKKNMAKKGQIPATTQNSASPKGLLNKFKAKKAANSSSSNSSVPATKKKKGFLKKVVSKINKVNPATVLLRNGVLASMKLNIKNVAKRLRWSYLTPEQAATKGILLEKFQKLVATRQKLENIFTVAGGKVDNLKKAILGGKGNKDKAMSGLGTLPMIEHSDYMNSYTSLGQLLGPEMYYSENIDGMEGLGQLGEPVTLTAIAAAAGVIAGIVASLKQIGDIFGGGKKESADFDESKTDAPENNVDTSKVQTSSLSPAVANDTSLPVAQESFDNGESNSSPTNSSTTDNSSTPDDMDEFNEDGALVTTNNAVTTTNTATKTPSTLESFWDKNKSWLKPAAIGAGGLTLIAIGFHLMKKDKRPKRSSSHHSLSGVPRKRKKKHSRKKKRQKPKRRTHHKRAIALL